MKNVYKVLLVLICFNLAAGYSRATNHTIEVEDFEFNPRNLNVQVGDTITWLWHNGFHTTTSDMIPSGAASWDATLSSTSTSFTYVVHLPGTYDYHCTPHQSMGMTGSFVASGTTGVGNYAAPAINFNFYRNADENSLSLRFVNGSNSPVDFNLMDLSGRTVLSSPALDSEAGSVYTFNTSHLSEGIYIAELHSGSTREVRRLILN